MSVVDDDGASHPQAGVGVGRGQDQPLRRPLGDPAQGDLLTGLPAGVSQLGARQHSPGPPGGVDDGAGHASSRERAEEEKQGFRADIGVVRERRSSVRGRFTGVEESLGVTQTFEGTN